MNASRRRANLRIDQLRRALNAGHGNTNTRARWQSYIRADRDPRPLEPLGALSWCVRLNLRGRDGSHETDAYTRDFMRRKLAAHRAHQPQPCI